MTDNGGGGPADSYIGSLISLTSKSEIRYEGLLYTVDTENSKIALQNVRSFGTEGRKKDGPQIPASDKIYEFIIFQGTDIKDLQVKMSPPSSIHNDPAIISLQAQASQPPSAPPPYVPPVGDLTGHHSTYKASPAPFYHSASSGVPLWAPPAPPQVPSGNVPLFWQGFYVPPDQHRLMEPPSVSVLVPVPVPAPTVSQGISVPLTPATLSALAPLGQEQISSPPVAGSTFTLSPPSHSLVTPELSRRGSTGVPAVEPVHPNHLGPGTPLPMFSSQPPSLSFPNAVSSGLQHEGTGADIQRSERDEKKVQPHRDAYNIVDPSGVSSSSMSSPATSTVRKGSFAPGRGPMVYKQVNKQMQVSKDHLHSGQRMFAPNLHSPSARPLLPLPSSPTQHMPSLKMYEGSSRITPMRRGGSRGGGMGRASRSAHSGSKLLEDFDFIAMNQKFNKEEVWDELLKVESKDRISEETGAQGLDYGLESKEFERSFDGSASDLSRRSVYVKDDFFDSLSCDSLGRGHGKQERVKFTEQRKIDAETFGSSQIRSYRGGGGYHGRHGGSRGRRSAGRGQGHAFGYHNVSRGDGRVGPAG